MKLRTDEAPLRAGDPRLGHLLGTATGAPLATLLGFPVDEGVTINGGRAGAAEAPGQLRAALSRLAPDARLGEAFLHTLARSHDRGDFGRGLPLEDAQRALALKVAEDLSQGAIPIVFGGGHETTFGHFLGYVEKKLPCSLLNLDAHPDVRERINGRPHSGSSFRDALEHPSKMCAHYTVLGLQPQSVAASHLRYLEEKGGRYLWHDEVSEAAISDLFRRLSQAALVSIDLDVVDVSYAPGVSAPSIGGLTPALLFHFAFEAGRSPFVRSLDIVELNPKFDRDGQTAKLGALAIWHFLRGLSARKP